MNSEDDPEEKVLSPFRGLSVGLVLTYLAGVVAVTSALALLLWHIASTAASGDRASLELDAIKTALAVAAGLSGLGALLLNARRQWLSERSQLHTERASVASQLDALEKRVTDAFAKAAELLGSDQHSKALAGLYSLERLGQAYPDQRQTMIELLCGYIRVAPQQRDYRDPEAAEPAAADVADGDAQAEVFARIAEVIARHLRPEVAVEVDRVANASGLIGLAGHGLHIGFRTWVTGSTA
jgi:hypothetical protein